MEQGKRKEDEQQLHAVRFAAGVAVLMACLERAAVVSFYEHWRVWVFLTLNLLLLAILFTSNHTTCSSGGSIGRSNNLQEEKYADDVKHKSEKEKILKQCSALEPANSSDDNMKMRKSESTREERDGERGEEEENVAKKSNGLSKEELNEKAEAFIAMFRQQYLVPHHSEVAKNTRKNHQKPLMGYPSNFIPSHISVG